MDRGEGGEMQTEKYARTSRAWYSGSRSPAACGNKISTVCWPRESLWPWSAPCFRCSILRTNLIRWRAVEALDRVTATLADEKPEAGRDILRRGGRGRPSWRSYAASWRAFWPTGGFGGNSSFLFPKAKQGRGRFKVQGEYPGILFKKI